MKKSFGDRKEMTPKHQNCIYDGKYIKKVIAQ